MKSDLQRQYIYSERAHYMCPMMHFGIFVSFAESLDMQKVKISLDELAQAHSFLRSVIRYQGDNGNLYYDVNDKSTIDLYEKESEQTLWEDYNKISQKEWNVFHHGLLKVFTYPSEGGVKLLFVSHHLLGDGRCLLELVNEFADLYVEGIKPVFVQESLIKGITDLPEKSNLTGVSKLLVKSLNKRWKKERKSVTYEDYASFSDDFVRKNPVSYQVTEVKRENLILMKEYCKENKITINDLLMAKTYMELHTQKIIMAADIRPKLKCYNQGALGNYSSAMSIVCKSKGRSVVEISNQVHKCIQESMNNNKKLMLVLACYLMMDQGLIDAAAISTLGDFESRAARFVGAGMFGFSDRTGLSITNLGKIKNKNIVEATFIPPASPATIQTLGVLTVNDRMKLCSSYYEDRISSGLIKKYHDALACINMISIHDNGGKQ